MKPKITACSCGALAPLATLKGRDYVKDYKVQIMKLKTTEKGFTLIELLVGIAIAVFVVGAASMTIITMMRLSPQSNNWAIALRQVQNTGYWISRDVQMSQEIDDNPPPPEFLRLTLPQPPPALAKTIVYQFEDMSGGLKRLMRNDQTAGQSIMIAEYIYYDPVNDPYDSTQVISYLNRKFTVKIAAVISGDEKVIRQYETMQRVPAP
jgi:prepilin-type N-terminal cleavage/methylation domain-containing protein